MKFQVRYDVIDLNADEAFEEDVLSREVEVVEAENSNDALYQIKTRVAGDGIGVYFYECNWVE